VHPAAAPISQAQRLALIRRVHDDQSIPLQDRVVTLLIQFYAQPLIKIARLTITDVELDDGKVRLRLGGVVLAEKCCPCRSDGVVVLVEDAAHVLASSDAELGDPH
jgi:hypothetical protein